MNHQFEVKIMEGRLEVPGFGKFDENAFDFEVESDLNLSNLT